MWVWYCRSHRNDKWCFGTADGPTAFFMYPSECNMMIPGTYAQMLADYGDD